MRKRLKFILIGICYLILFFMPTGKIQEVRWVPNRWCGANPPYTGTLFIGATFGLPLTWVEVGRFEKCTTGGSIIDDYVFHPESFMFNMLIFGMISIIIVKIPSSIRKA